jgi:hypothetical protein
MVVGVHGGECGQCERCRRDGYSDQPVGWKMSGKATELPFIFSPSFGVIFFLLVCYFLPQLHFASTREYIYYNL